MLDHAFLDTIASIRHSLDTAMLERVALEEQFQSDLLLGDLSFETSYALPGATLDPVPVVADISLLWSTFSQAAMRSVMIGESPDEDPSVTVEISIRVRNLKTMPDPTALLATLGNDKLQLGPTKLHGPQLSMETSYAGTEVLASGLALRFDEDISLDEESLLDERGLDKLFAPVGGWITSRLVKLGDYPFEYVDKLFRKRER